MKENKEEPACEVDSGTCTFLERVGLDGWDRPIYRDVATGKLWKDIDLGWSVEPSLYSSSSNDIDGEPDMPFRGEYRIIDGWIAREPSARTCEADYGIEAAIANATAASEACESHVNETKKRSRGHDK